MGAKLSKETQEKEMEWELGAKDRVPSHIAFWKEMAREEESDVWKPLALSAMEILSNRLKKDLQDRGICKVVISEAVCFEVISEM